jgi:transcriptional regulator with XRE-family HTH domain
MAADMPGAQVPEEKPLGELLREVCDSVDQETQAISDAEIESRLQQLMDSRPASRCRAEPAASDRSADSAALRERQMMWSLDRLASAPRPGRERAAVSGALARAAGAGAGTSVRLRQLGSQLRRLREAQALELPETAARLGMPASTLERIETGRSSAPSSRLQSMLDVYGVHHTGHRQALIEMAQGGHQRNWWAVWEEQLPAGFGLYVSLEAEAASLRVFEPQLIFGLLQTEEYARAVLTMVRRRATPREIDQLVDLRMTRQQVLSRPDPLHLHVILDEAALRRPIGPSHLMRRQLTHLCDAAVLPTVTLQVLDFASGVHPALNGSYSIIGLPGHATPDVVYSEGVGGHAYIEERPEEVRERSDTFGLLTSAALPAAESLHLIHAIAQTFT